VRLRPRITAKPPAGQLHAVLCRVANKLCHDPLSANHLGRTKCR